MKKVSSFLWLIKQKLIFYIEVIIRKKTPIIIYQMGKVGSTSIAISLKRAGVSPVFHVHRMNPSDISRIQKEYEKRKLGPPQNDLLGEFLRHEIVIKKRQAKYVVLYRNPAERNISAFFQNFERYTGVKPDDYDGSIDELANVFISKYEHNVSLKWFDRELKKVLGIDVYNSKFSKKKGYAIYKTKYTKLLLLKTSLSDKNKTYVIGDFLNLSPIRITRSNVGKDKDYAKLYNEFKQKIKVNTNYYEKFNKSKVARYFFTKQELKQTVQG